MNWRKFFANVVICVVFTVSVMLMFALPASAEVEIVKEKTSILDFLKPYSDSIEKGKIFSPNIKISGYTQLKFLANKSDGEQTSEFEIMRARLKLSGDLNKYFAYNFMFGALEPPPAKDRKAEVVNAFIDVKFAPYANLRAGQFFIPFGYEGPHVITKNDMIERSDLTAVMNSFAIFRDIGVMFFGDAEKLRYKLSLTNGAGANKRDDNSRKDVMGTVQYSLLDDLMLGFSGHLGSFADSGNRAFNRKRWNAHVVYKPNKFSLIGEFTHREQEADPAAGDFALIRSNGFYALAGYHIFDDFQTVVRYTMLDNNLDKGDDMRRCLTFGVNFFYGEHVRVAANYEVRDEEKNPAVGNRFTLMLQGSF